MKKPIEKEPIAKKKEVSQVAASQTKSIGGLPRSQKNKVEIEPCLPDKTKAALDFADKYKVKSGAVQIPISENGSGKIIEVEEKSDDPKKLETVESIEFVREGNKIELRFSKSSNRLFRIQIFLNGQIEIRPVTYTGASTGYSFWNMLKGIMKI